MREGFLEHEAYMKLRNVLPDGVQLLFVVAYHVGCRTGELLKVKWSQVDLVANRIQLAPRTTKNKQARTLPIYGEMIERLRLEKQIRDTKYPDCQAVFHRQGRPVRNFNKAWAAARKRAGLDGLLFHDLRRTAMRNMARPAFTRKPRWRFPGTRPGAYSTATTS